MLGCLFIVPNSSSSRCTINIVVVVVSYDGSSFLHPGIRKDMHPTSSGQLFIPDPSTHFGEMDEKVHKTCCNLISLILHTGD